MGQQCDRQVVDSPRFVDCEKWRKDFNVDHLVRNFEYKEKPEVSKFYPQFYHKTDKVRSHAVDRGGVGKLTTQRMGDRSISSSSEIST